MLGPRCVSATCDNVLSYQTEAIIKSICLGIASTRPNNTNLHQFPCINGLRHAGEKYLATNDLFQKIENYLVPRCVRRILKGTLAFPINREIISRLLSGSIAYLRSIVPLQH